MNDDFYVGYEPLMPASLATRIRVAAIGLVAVAVVVSGVLIVAQDGFAAATFEFGRSRMFEGRLVEYPYPALIASGPTGDTSGVYWLVGPGKHGAAGIAKGHDGRSVRVSGMLIERDGDRMIEVASLDAITVIESRTTPVEALHPLGAVELAGEIVDSKCHLGVMKPGEGPTHRDCAVRCLLGRVTPMLVTDGPRRERIALVDRNGRPFTDAFDALAGRPVEIRGELLARGPLRFIATNDVRAR